MFRTGLLLLFTLLLFTCVPAQSVTEAAVDLSLERMAHQRKAMLVLGGWAVGNIGLGLAMRANTGGESRRFHEMNAIWNVVNLGIAGFSYYSALGEPVIADAFEGLQKDITFQKILLFNAGLDVGYLLGGLYLIERGRRPEADEDRLRGYGKAVMLQGGFLLVFDLVNYFIASGRNNDYRLLLGPVGEGMGLSLTF